MLAPPPLPKTCWPALNFLSLPRWDKPNCSLVEIPVSSAICKNLETSTGANCLPPANVP